MRIGLFWKLFATCAASVLVATAIADSLLRREWERSYKQHLTASLTEKVSGLREAAPPIEGCQVSPAIRGMLADAVRRHAAAMRVRATAIDRCGNVLADSEANPEEMENHAGRTEFRAAIERGETGVETRTSHTLAVPYLYVAVPARGANAGAVRVSYPLDQIEQETTRIRNQILAASGTALAIALVLAAIFARALSSRTRRIVDFAEHVAEGDFRARVREASGDELGQVARALNATADKLENSFAESRDARERLETVLNSMQEPVLAVSGERRVMWFNSRMKEMASSLEIGRPMVESLRNPELLRAVRKTLETREVHCTTLEIPEQGRSFRVTAAPLGAQGAVAVLTEITEIERTEKVRRDFIANVSHELRTPLTSIQGYTETLLENAPPSEQREFLEIIRKHAKRMARLTEDLLTLARVESGEDALRPRPVAPSVVLNEAAENMKELARLSGRKLAVENDSEHVVLCDIDKIEQVLANLVENALKYSSPETTVTLGATDAEGGVRFFVRDQGPGVPSEHLSRLFERFYRADRGRSLESGGTGLGLAIAKHIVLKHGGSIHADSEVGRGSTFSFLLPYADRIRDTVFTDD